MSDNEIWTPGRLKRLAKDYAEVKDMILVRGSIGSGARSGSFQMSAGVRGISSQFVFINKLFKDYTNHQECRPIIDAPIFIFAFIDKKNLSKEVLEGYDKEVKKERAKRRKWLTLITI